MAYCKNCGAEISDQATVCPKCGVPTKTRSAAVDDNGGFGWGLLGFCLPIVGLILYLVWMNTKPNTAKAAGIGALISVGVNILFTIIALASGLY